MSKKWVLGALILAGLIVGGIGWSSEEAEATDCRDVEFLFLRGSGTEYNNSDAWHSFRMAVDTHMPAVGVSYRVSDVDYPAVGITAFNALGIWVSGGEAFKFGDSMRTGADNLVKYYENRVKQCGGTKFVVTGYSQGAMAMARALERMDARRVLYVAAMGDPELYLPEGEGATPPACRGEGLSVYRAHVPNCHTKQGILGARKPYEVAGYNGKFGLWCIEEDMICGSSRNLLINSGHSKYDDLGHFEAAVRQAILRIQQEFFGIVQIGVGKQVAMDTAILIDSTGSMAEFIFRYKAEALRLAELTYGGGGRVALYEYRDLLDPFDLVQLCDFECSFSEFKDKLDRIRTMNGGDWQESLLNGALGVMNTLEWRKGATKSIVVLTDASYHSPDRDGTALEQVVRRSLEIDPVNIYVVTESGVLEAYTELTELTGGKVFEIGEMEETTNFMISRPVAILPFEIYYGAVGERFYFDASDSYGVAAEIDYYEWDLDGDGEFELQTEGASASKMYFDEGEHFVVVKVVARDGGFATMSARVIVGDGVETEAEIGGLKRLEVNRVGESEIWVSWRLSEDGVVLLMLDGVILGYAEGLEGEIVIGEVDYARNVEVGVAGMDAEFNIGTFEYVLVGGDKNEASSKQDHIIATQAIGGDGARDDDVPMTVRTPKVLSVEEGVKPADNIDSETATIAPPDTGEASEGFLWWAWGCLAAIMLMTWLLYGGKRRKRRSALTGGTAEGNGAGT